METTKIRIRKPRSFGKNMLIVCEDTHTAPNYLKVLKAEAINKGFWDEIEIYPTLEPDTEQKKDTTNAHKTPRRKRQFKELEENESIDIVLEPENAEQPVRYVRTVQKAMADGSYSEGWAVFDLDGHTGQKRAAEMALENPKVNIAFSSRSIEMWFLLHFQQPQTTFQKTICKKDKKELNCNKENPCQEDGKGECLIGFLRRNYLENYGKNKDMSVHLNLLLFNALANALRLREKYDSSLPFYERNPYTTMDFLVKSLLNLVVKDDERIINNFRIKVNQTHPAIELHIQNISEQRRILNTSHFRFENVETDFNLDGGGIFEANEARTLTITPHTVSPNLELRYPANNETDFIRIVQI